MGGCKPIKFQNVTRAKFQAVRARAVVEATAVENSGDTGWAKGPTPVGDVTVAWTYDEPSQTLTLQCTSKPMFLSESLIAGKIQSLAGNALNG